MRGEGGGKVKSRPRSCRFKGTPWSKSGVNSKSAIAHPLAGMFAWRRVREERKWAAVAQHTNKRRGRTLGHSCLLFSKVGTWIFIQLADVIRNKYATNK